MKSTKRKLIFSSLSLILCAAILIGTTFAWFTDTATSGVNKIQAGTLDIELLGEDGESLEGQTLSWIKADGSEEVLWEPGCTYKLPNLYIKNNGNLALKFKILISGVTGEAKLLEAIDFTMKVGEDDLRLDSPYALAPSTTTEAIVISGHMKETAGNEYQGLSLDGISITVLATQDTVEHDSISDQYDATAEYPVYITVPVAPNGANTVVQDKAEEPTVQIVVPAAALAPEASVVKVSVEKRSAAPATLVLEDDMDSQSFDVSVEGIAEDNSTPITVQMFVGKFKTNVKVYHNEVLLEGTVYDAETGYVSFTTTSFSPFTVVYDGAAPSYLKTGREINTALKGGSKGYKDNDLTVKAIYFGSFDQYGEAVAGTTGVQVDDGTGKPAFLYRVLDTADNKYTVYILAAGPIYAAAYARDMFRNMRVLKVLDMANLNTSRVEDFSCMFYYDLALTALDVTGFDTGNATLMDLMFYGCSQLASLDVSGFDTAKVTSMEQMFSDCKKLTTIDVSDFDTGEVTSMFGMFNLCEKVTVLDVSGFDTSKVVNMEGLFSGCKTITALDVTGFNTANVTNMKSMFYGCKAVPTLDVSSFDTSKVTNMMSMFSMGQPAIKGKLTQIIFSSKFDTSKVTEMSHMFDGANALTTLDLSGFDTSSAVYCNSMFENCKLLQTIYVSDAFDVSGATNTSYMFAYCNALVGGNGTTYAYANAGGAYACIDTATTPGYFSEKS